MKPLHVGLLVLGAGVAAGVALKMTQLPPTVPAPSAVPPPVVAASPAAGAIPQAPQPKPSPIPGAVRVSPPRAVRATAPEPIYNEPPKPAIRKAPPAPVHAAANIKPKQWIPGRYDSSGGSASASAAARAVPKPASAPASSPVVVASLEKSPTPPVLPAVEQKPVAAPHQATLRPGMAIAIRLGETLSSNFSPTGGTFAGTLAEPLVADGFVIAERGARVAGRVLDSEKAGRSTGISRLQIGLTNVSTSDGQDVPIATEPWLRLGDTLPAETVVRFRLTSKVTITERQLDGK